MTDEPDEIETALASLEATQKRTQRQFRRAVVASLGTLLLLAVIDAGFVLLGGGVWVHRDLVTVGGLTLLGMLGYLHTSTAYRMIVRLDAELIEAFRRQGQMSQALEEVRPLMAAIEEARVKGVPLLIPPGSVPAAPAPRTVH